MRVVNKKKGICADHSKKQNNSRWGKCWKELRKQVKDRKKNFSSSSLLPSGSSCRLQQRVESLWLWESKERTDRAHLCSALSCCLCTLPFMLACVYLLTSLHSHAPCQMSTHPHTEQSSALLVTLACERLLSRSPTPTARCCSHSHSHANIPTVPHSSQLPALLSLEWRGEREGV